MLSNFLKHSLTRKVLYSSKSVEPSSSLTLHFLKNSCGLSQETALSISGKLSIKRTKTPHAVLTLLKSYNFSQPDIENVVTHVPKLLLSNPDTIIKPKLEFFEKIGFSGRPLVRLITCVPTLLTYSLENNLLPNYNILKGLLHTNDNVASAVRNSPAILVLDLDKTLLPKIKILKGNGVSVDVINKLLIMRSKALVGRSDYRFNEIFDFLKKTRISPQSSIYAHAFGVLGKMKENEWEMKVQNFKKLGWTEEEVMVAFEKHPYCMSASIDKITQNFVFLKEKYGWNANYVSRCSVALSFSFEKRVLPRYRVLNTLKSRGLYGGKFGQKQLRLGEKKFLVEYVIKYYKEVPELIDEDIKRSCEKYGLLIDNDN